MSVNSVPMSAVSGQFTASEFEQDTTAARRARQQQLLLLQQQKMMQQPPPTVPEDRPSSNTDQQHNKAQPASGAAGAAAAVHASSSTSRNNAAAQPHSQPEIQPAGGGEAAAAARAAAAASASTATQQQQQQQQAASEVVAAGPAAAGTPAPTAPLRIGGQQLYIDDRRNILFHNTDRRVLTSQDGCVMHLAQHGTARHGRQQQHNKQPHAPAAPYAGLIAEPHIHSKTGHPYQATHGGQLYPLCLTPRGKPYVGPDGKPLLLGSPRVAPPGSAAAIARLGSSSSSGGGGVVDAAAAGATNSTTTVAGFPALPSDTVLVWPILTRSGKGSALQGAAGEALAFAAIPSDFPYLSAAAAATVWCSSAAAAAAGQAAALADRSASGAVGTAADTAGTGNISGGGGGSGGGSGGGVASSSGSNAAAGPVLIALATGEPLLAADGSRVQLSPNGQGFTSTTSGRVLYGATGQPLTLLRHHRSRSERVHTVLQSLQTAADEGRLSSEVVGLVKTMMQHKQGHVVAEAALAGLLLVLAATWVAALLLLPTCLIGLGGSHGCAVSLVVCWRFGLVGLLLSCVSDIQHGVCGVLSCDVFGVTPACCLGCM